MTHWAMTCRIKPDRAVSARPHLPLERTLSLRAALTMQCHQRRLSPKAPELGDAIGQQISAGTAGIISTVALRRPSSNQCHFVMRGPPPKPALGATCWLARSYNKSCDVSELIDAQERIQLLWGTAGHFSSIRSSRSRLKAIRCK